MPRKKIELETSGAELVEKSDSRSPEQETFADAIDAVGTGSMLGYRLEQQAVLSNFGMEALKSTSVGELLKSAALAAALGMRASWTMAPVDARRLFLASLAYLPLIFGMLLFGGV